MGLVGSALAGSLPIPKPAFCARRNIFTAAAADSAFCQVHSRHHTMSPPLAGSMKMRLADFCNSTAWALRSTWAHTRPRDISLATRSAPSPRTALARICRRSHLWHRPRRLSRLPIWIYRKYRLLDVTPRIPADELAKRFASRQPRTCSSPTSQPRYYDADSERIAGSIRINPTTLVEEVKHLPKGSRDLSLLHLSAAKPPAPVWRVNSRIWDFSRFSLSQRLRAWRKAGHPVERVPTTT